MDNPFSNILAGSVGFFTKAGLLGGGAALLGVLGLVGGRPYDAGAGPPGMGGRLRGAD